MHRDRLEGFRSGELHLSPKALCGADRGPLPHHPTGARRWAIQEGRCMDGWHRHRGFEVLHGMVCCHDN